VSAELDSHKSSWCFDNSQLVVPPFTLIETQAEAHGLRAHTLGGGHIVRTRDSIPFVQELTCPDPTECPSGETRDGPPSDDDRNPPCFFLVRIGISHPESVKVTGGTGHDWLDMGSWVDGVTNVFWWQDALSDASDDWLRDPK
jgi:hypothetical protein